MKEYFLVPTYELEQLKKTSEMKSESSVSKNLSDDKEIFHNNIISKADILELHNQINRLRRETELLTKQGAINKKVDSDLSRLNSKRDFNHVNKQIIEENVPKAYFDEGYDMITKLHENGIINFDQHDNVINVENGEKIKMKDFLRSVFIKEAKVSHIPKFLKTTLSKVNQNYIRNRKALEMIRDKSEKKILIIITVITVTRRRFFMMLVT